MKKALCMCFLSCLWPSQLWAAFHRTQQHVKVSWLVKVIKSLIYILQKFCLTCWELLCKQGCGVEESGGFWTWGVGVAENFNDSDSGLTFYSPIVTVCATNVRKRHTWQFKQLNVSTRDDHGYSERLQHTNLHTHTQGQFQVSSDTRADHATYAEWVQPFEACVTEIFICFHSGWHYCCSVTLVTQQAMRSSHENSSIVTQRTSQSNDIVSKSCAY